MGCASSKNQHPAMYVVPVSSLGDPNDYPVRNGCAAVAAVEDEGRKKEETNETGLTAWTADQIAQKEEYERHHLDSSNSAGAVRQPQPTQKKKKGSSTSRASSTSPAPAASRTQKRNSGMPQYLGVPPPKSLSVLRREKGVNGSSLEYTTSSSSTTTMKREDAELNGEIDRYIMMTLLERERDVVRGKADVLRATSGKISNALEKERNSFKTAKENKKEKATTSATTSDPSSLHDSLSTVFGAIFSNDAPITEEEQRKRKLEQSSSSETTMTMPEYANDVQDLCGELLKIEDLTHMHAASGAVLDSRFINGRRDAPGDWVEVTPASPPRRKSRTSSSKKKKKKVSNGGRASSNNSSAAAHATTTATTTTNTNIRGHTSSHYNSNTRSESSKPKAPPTNVGQQQKYSTYSSAVDGSDYFSPISTPRKQEMKKSSLNSLGNNTSGTNNGGEKNNTLSRSSSRSRLSNSASVRDKMLNSSGASRSGGGGTDTNTNNNNYNSNNIDGSNSMGCDNDDKEVREHRTSSGSNVAPGSPREIGTVPEERMN